MGEQGQLGQSQRVTRALLKTQSRPLHLYIYWESSGMNRSLVLCTAASGTSTVVDSSSGATVMNYFSSEDAVLRSSCVAQTALGFMLQHSNKPHMHLYNWAKKQPTTRCAAPEPILCVCSDVSNSFVFAGSASGKGYIWSSSTGDLLAQWNAHFRGVSCIAATHDSAFVVTGGDDGLVQVGCPRSLPSSCRMSLSIDTNRF